MPRAEGEGRRDRRKRERRARIYDAARRLFLAQGVDATTVEQIAATADIAPATFFNHFPSKREVLNEMTREVFEFLGSAIEQQLKASGGTRERLARLAAEAADGIGQSRTLAREVLLELMRSTAPSGSLPVSVIVTAVSSSVPTDRGSATGGWFVVEETRKSWFAIAAVTSV